MEPNSCNGLNCPVKESLLTQIEDLKDKVSKLENKQEITSEKVSVLEKNSAVSAEKIENMFLILNEIKDSIKDIGLKISNVNTPPKDFVKRMDKMEEKLEETAKQNIIDPLIEKQLKDKMATMEKKFEEADERYKEALKSKISDTKKLRFAIISSILAAVAGGAVTLLISHFTGK